MFQSFVAQSGRFFVILILTLPFQLTIASPPQGSSPAIELLKKTQKNIEARDDSALVIMKIIEANGEVKTRTLSLQTLRDTEFYALVRIKSPADLKGTAFLAEISKSKEDQWLYLPSTKQVRRVVGTKKGAGILGSELTIEDLNSTAIKSSSLKLIAKSAMGYKIELIPKKSTSAYQKVIIQLSAKDFLPVKTTYYSGGKVKKEVYFKNYIKIGNVYRAQLIQVKNLTSKRGTDIELKDLVVNSNLNKSDFTSGALKPN